MRNTFLAIIIFSISLLIGLAVKAQTMAPKLGVAPPLFELSVKRGQVLQEKIKVYNPGDVAMPIHVRPTDFTAEEESGRILFDESAQDSSFASRLWFKVENPDFILEPKEVSEIKFSVNIPEDAEPGGHYANLMLEPQLPSFYFEEDKPRVIPYVGVLFLFSVNVEGLVRPEVPLTVVEFNIPERFHLKRLENFIASVSAAGTQMFSVVESGNLPFSLRIRNDDIYHAKVSGKLAIKGVGETEIKQMTILPGRAREIPLDFKPKLPQIMEKYLPAAISNFISRNLMWGKYTASLELDNGIQESLDFWVFPWRTALIAILAIVLIAFLLVKYRKRMTLAIKVLFRRGKKFSTG